MSITPTAVDRDPEVVALAERHADAISDTGDGYTIERLARGSWRVECLWCDWNERSSTKRGAVEGYREHENAVLAPLRRASS